MRRAGGQLGFADHAVSGVTSRADQLLSEVSELLDWEALLKLLSPIYAAPTGRPSYPLATMLRVMLLQSWWGLSDPETEDQLRDRVSFRRFALLPLEGSVPDHTTIFRFREELVTLELGQALFAEVTRQLDAKGMVVRAGTLIDASLLRSAAAEPPKGGGRSAHDEQARWTKRGKKATFGYKMHVAVDAGSRLVRDVVVTPANVNDCVVGPQLIQGDEAAVYADQGYDSAAMRDSTTRLGALNGIMRRPNKHHPILPPFERARNAAIRRERAQVEGVFGTLKRGKGLARLRLRGLAKVTFEVIFACIALNLRRALSILDAPSSPKTA